MGQPAYRREGTLAGIRDLLPSFERQGFGFGENRNENLDQIVRKPIGSDRREVPVAVVSPAYALIQHTQVLSWLSEGLEGTKRSPHASHAYLWISEYGERMRLRVRFDDVSMTPFTDDPFVATVEAFNSVDKSCACEMRVQWRRMVCWNGLWVHGDACLRKIHNLNWMNRTDAAQFLASKLRSDDDLEAYLQHLARTQITASQTADWADHTLSEKWDHGTAARLIHIAATGYDGRVGRASARTPPSAALVSSDVRVPGVEAPVRNLYGLAQVLTWLAGTRADMEEVDLRTNQAYRQIRDLEASL